MIVLRSPKGWTGPKEVDGLKVEGFWRAHQVPIANPRGNPEHLRLLEHWMRSYQPEKLFDESGRLARRSAGARAGRRAAHGRQSACQWRIAEARTQTAGFPRLCRGGATAPAASMAKRPV